MSLEAARAAALQQLMRDWDIYDELTLQAVLENDAGFARALLWLQHCGCCKKQDRAAHRQAR